MIKGSENLLQIKEISENLLPVFEKHGLGAYMQAKTLDKIGKFTRLNTLLASKNIDTKAFISLLNDVIETTSAIKEVSLQEKFHFSAMLPCGLRNPFKEYFDNFIQSNQEGFKGLNYLIEGNVNHELSYYPMLDNITDIDELPDIIMASDVNNFFHKPFVDRFINAGLFETYSPLPLNDYLEKAGFSDPQNNYTNYTTNLLVIVVDKKRLKGRPKPHQWNDLLNPEFKNDIIMRGEDNFFCNAVMLPFYKDIGIDAIKILANNIKSGLHPAEMVKMAGKDNPNGAAIYIMPYFFSKRIKSNYVETIWPKDGAIASPVFLLVKKDKAEEHKKLLDFIFSKDTAEMLLGRYFPAIHPEISHENFPEPVKWLGWDFLKNNDIGLLKETIREEFMKIWNNKMPND